MSFKKVIDHHYAIKCCVCLFFCWFLQGCQSSGTLEEPISINAIIDPPLCDIADPGHDCDPNDEGVIEVIHPEEALPIPDLISTPVQNIEETNLWFHIANNLVFESPQNEPRIDKQKKRYLNYPKYMQRVSERASPFLFYIVEELEKNNLPLDLALLPIVESAFDPFAYSHGRAAGMWQFIPETGKRFGMTQNWWIDGRRDVVLSTQGAIAYLKYLHKMFDGDWLHALAAYNSGEGRVKRAIKRNKAQNKATDFWSLSLPRETRAYVPRLLALADILKNREKYSYNWPEIKNSPVIEIVEVDRQIDLSKVAELAGLSFRELQALNPGFNRWASPPKKSHLFILPKDKAASFKTDLANTSEDELISWQRHKIRNGESLGTIAKKYGTTIEAIRHTNKIKGSTIYAGKYLLIATSLNEADKHSLPVHQRFASMAVNNANQNTKTVHTVRSGDTLWDIAKAYDVPVSRLASWNAMSTKDTLSIGTKLIVLNGQSQPINTTRKISYNVRSGDSLSKIANKFKVRISDIVKWNSLEGQKYLQPGQVLKVVIDYTKS